MKLTANNDFNENAAIKTLKSGHKMVQQNQIENQQFEFELSVIAQSKDGPITSDRITNTLEAKVRHEKSQPFHKIETNFENKGNGVYVSKVQISPQVETQIQVGWHRDQNGGDGDGDGDHFITNNLSDLFSVQIWPSWMETSDNSNGLRRVKNCKIAFLVSTVNAYDVNKKYPLPPGYRWATTEEADRQLKQSGVEEWNYYNQEGWREFEWGGVKRVMFLCRDSFETKKCCEAGGYSSRGVNWSLSDSDLQLLQTPNTPDYPFGGLVCIAENEESVGHK